MNAIRTLCLLLLIGCIKGEDEPPKQIPFPERAELLLPLQNSACVEGTVVSDSVSTVTLKWKPGAHTDNYSLQVKNLLTKEVQSHRTSGTELNLSLKRNTPYSWWVVSRSNQRSDTAQTSAWKFFNAGVAAVAYAPFPAELLSPAAGKEVTAADGKINLEWKGEDVDKDLMEYDVYFGTAIANLNLLKAKLQHQNTVMTFSGVAVQPQTTYYWKVVSHDSKGNTSESEIGTFRVN